MFWQDTLASLINQNPFIRIIVVIAILVIMFRMSVDPRIILQTILIATMGVFGLWLITNIDYIFHIVIK